MIDNQTADNLSALARGTYQYALLTGTARWSGGDLAGKARRFGGVYAASRRAVLRRLHAAGYVTHEERRGRYRVRVLVVTRPTTTAEDTEA